MNPTEVWRKEVDEDMESRSGPYTRAGRPAGEASGGSSSQQEGGGQSAGDPKPTNERK